MKRQQVVLVLEKQTKGTYVYATDDESAVCRTVYLRKDAVGRDVPDRITLTVEAGEAGDGEPDLSGIGEG